MNAAAPAPSLSPSRPTAGAGKPRVVVAGASGFVGRALGPLLEQRGLSPVGLTRDPGRYTRGVSSYQWMGCELYSLLDAELALEGADYAVYLVHSMMPSARLTQGSFRDLDLVCADNFARAAHAAGVKHIVYLSGLVPDEEVLSEHLASRLEVEKVLAAYGTPVTTIRAGMVIGSGGSSYQMMVRLVRRLPAMVCPKWTTTMTQPVALTDVVKIIAATLGDERLFGEAFDVGVPQPLSYREMMERTASILNVTRPMVGVPLLSPRLSRLWVSLITGAPRELVAPLLESMVHALTARDHRIYQLLGLTPTPYDQAVKRALAQEQHREKVKPRAFVGASRREQAPAVCSVQRLPLPQGRNAIWVAESYMQWLPRAMWPFIAVTTDEARCCKFYLRGISAPLLVLRFAPDRSHPDRQLFYVVGGLLCENVGRGRLEMRITPDRRSLICALHDFHPRLPWFVYLATQSQVHLWVMRGFGRHLSRQPALAG